VPQKQIQSHRKALSHQYQKQPQKWGIFVLDQKFCFFYTKIFAFLTPKFVLFLHQNVCFFTPKFMLFTPIFLLFYTKNFAFFAPKCLLFLHQKSCFFYTNFVYTKIFAFFTQTF